MTRALTPCGGGSRSIYVWLELVETQHAAAQAAAAITLPDGSEAARKLRTLLATTQRVSALVDSADELLYMHVLPSGKESAAAQAPPKAAPAKKQEEASHNLHGCCCCCPSRSSGGRDAKRGGAANSVALSTRSHKPRRSLTDSESDRDEDEEEDAEEDKRGRGRRSSRRQRRRRARGDDSDDSDDDRSRSLDDEMRGNDVRLYDALVANRIRMSSQLARPPRGMGPGPRGPGAPTAGGDSHGRHSLTPRTRGDGVGMAARGRSPARSDRPSGAGSLSPARGHPYRQSGTQSPAENSSGRKRRRTQADRQPSPSHQRAYPGSAPIDDGVDRMSKSEAAGLTAEAVLGMRWNYSQKEYKVKWVGIDKPVWIARRKCPSQAALLIEVYTKGLRRQRRTGRQQQEEKEKASSSSAQSSKKGKKNSGTESESLYTVEKLIGVRTKHNKRQFLVRWDGYDSSEDTWEFVDELRKYVPDIVEDYEAHLKRERERKAQASEHISERAPAKEAPARGDGNGDAEEGDERVHGGDEEALDKEQQRMLQGIRGGSDADEEEDDDDGMEQQEDSEDDEEHDDRDHAASGEQLTRYSQGRYSKPLFLSRSGQQDSEEDDDDDGDAHEPDHDLDEDMDDDNDDDDDDDRVSIDFSGDTGMRRYIPITSTRPTSGAGSVVESAKELLRRLRA